jgi:hypothetical protein
MKTLNILITAAAFFALTMCNAQPLPKAAKIANARTVQVAISGNCGMCEATIEKAAFVKREAMADWDVDAKSARITFDSTRTAMDAVLKRIALAGYDNERYLAPDAAYAALPGCCQYERSLKPANMATTNGSSAHTGAAYNAPLADTQDGAGPFDAVLAAYFKLKDALVASDAAEAEKRAVVLDEAFHSLDATKLNEDLQATLAPVFNEVMASLHPLGDTDDLVKQRALFAKLTPGILQLAKAVPSAQPVYLDHCPMYNGGADWLSSEKGIKNPFYGSAMLTCGSVKETISK